MVYKIYSLSDPDTKKVRYIGYTSKSLAVRLKAHINDCNKKITSHKANWIRCIINKNKTPIIELICECLSMEEAMNMEIYHISINSDLTNSTSGGERCKVYTKSVLRKMSENRKGKTVGEYNPMYGKKRPDLSMRNKIVNPLSVKKTSDKLRIMYNTDKYKKILMEAQACKPVLMKNYSGEVLRVFNSLREAGNNGFGRKEIMNVIKGKSKQHKGYLWEIKNA